MDEIDLVAIDARRRLVRKGLALLDGLLDSTRVAVMVNDDVPALMEEIKRLRAEASKMWEELHAQRGDLHMCACRWADPPVPCPTNPYRSAT